MNYDFILSQTQLLIRDFIRLSKIVNTFRPAFSSRLFSVFCCFTKVFGYLVFMINKIGAKFSRSQLNLYQVTFYSQEDHWVQMYNNGKINYVFCFGPLFMISGDMSLCLASYTQYSIIIQCNIPYYTFQYYDCYYVTPLILLYYEILKL